MTAHLILYDAKCSLCRNAVHRIQGWEKDKLFSYAPLDSGLGSQFFEKNAHLRNIDSLILIEDYNTQKRRIWLRGRAVMRILWLIGGWRKLIGWLAYFPIGVDGIYRIIARHRHRFKS